MSCQSIFRIKIQDNLLFFHSTIEVINGVKCKVFISYKKIKSCLGWRNRRRLYSNFLHARFRPISFCPCSNIITSSLTKTSVQSSKVPTDGVRPDAHRRGKVAFHDAVLCLHLDVCCIWRNGYILVCMGNCIIQHPSCCYASNHRISCNYVHRHGICTLPCGEKRDLVISSLTSIKYLCSGKNNEEDWHN